MSEVDCSMGRTSEIYQRQIGALVEMCACKDGLLRVVAQMLREKSKEDDQSAHNLAWRIEQHLKTGKIDGDFTD